MGEVPSGGWSLIGKVETFRSLSSPASFLIDKGDTRSGMETPSKTDSKEGAMGTEIGTRNGIETSQRSPSSEDQKSEVSKISQTSGFQHFTEAIIHDHPKSFDFSSQLSQQNSGSSVGEEFHTPEGDFEDQTGRERGESVFVFSGSGGMVQSKRRDATTAVPLLEGVASLVQGAGLVYGGEAANREVAMLTQQLELCSDDVS